MADSCADGFDIIIDDGSHVSTDQNVSLAYLFRHLKSSGFYVLEDLDCSRVKRNDPKMIDILIEFSNSGKFVSNFVSKDDRIYLENNIFSCEFFCKSDKKPNDYKICFITKK